MSTSPSIPRTTSVPIFAPNPAPRSVPTSVPMARTFARVLACVGFVGACAAETAPMPPPEDFVLTFADEFDGPADSLPDLAVWKLDLGTGPNGDGWGNGELQFYTGRPENVSLDGEGHLRIVAREESFGSRNYTSARIRTQDNFEQQYGRFEARIRVPAGQGLWPAFWMLGNDFPDAESTPEEARRGQWPGCGEIDVMEVRGQEPNVVAGTIHGPGYSGGESITESVVVEDPALDEDFHVFAVEWDPGRIAWFVDDRLYHVATTAQVRSLAPLPGATDPEWVFDHPFFLILNLAVGGGYVGPPDGTTPFPATLLVDYVRVYRRAE